LGSHSIHFYHLFSLLKVFDRKDVLRSEQLAILARLQRFAVAFATAGFASTSHSDRGTSDAAVTEPPMSVMRAAFCGYHADMLSSLILATEPLFRRSRVRTTASDSTKGKGAREGQEPTGGAVESTLKSDVGVSGSGISTDSPEALHEEAEVEAVVEAEDGVSIEEQVFQECVRRLLWIATPEAACRIISKDDRISNASATATATASASASANANASGVCETSVTAASKVPAVATNTDQLIAKEFGVRCSHEYFAQQRHSSLAAFAQLALLPSDT
jgi:hypothetical protein